MLKPAILYKNKLEEKFQSIWFDDKYKYWMNDSYNNTTIIQDTSYYSNQFVSVDINDNIIGYIGYSIDRSTECVSNISILNFTNNIITFGIDLKKAIEDIFLRFNFRKIAFYVVIGNPAEKKYDRMITRYGGRVVGISKEDTKLIDGKIYDIKRYEILRKDFINAFGKRYLDSMDVEDN